MVTRRGSQRMENRKCFFYLQAGQGGEPRKIQASQPWKAMEQIFPDFQVYEGQGDWVQSAWIL